MSPQARPPVADPTVPINSRWEAFERIAALVVLVLGARVLYLFIRYVLGFGAQRFHVESGAMLFLVVGLTYRLAQRRRFVESELTMVRVFGLRYGSSFALSRSRSTGQPSHSTLYPPTRRS